MLPCDPSWRGNLPYPLCARAMTPPPPLRARALTPPPSLRYSHDSETTPRGLAPSERAEYRANTTVESGGRHRRGRRGNVPHKHHTNLWLRSLKRFLSFGK